MTVGSPPAGADPVGGHRYRVEATTPAPVDVVWPLVGRAAAWR